MNYFVTAIGTDSGKTLVSAILTEMLHADYWKPVQSGMPRDTETVMRLVSNKQSQFFQEKYLLKTPCSPHEAAAIDGVHIDITEIVPPVSNRDLIIEGAGGVLVPLNDDEVMLDLMAALSAQIVLVADLYLGSINHTLLTASMLKSRSLDVRGIVFNGVPNAESERIILHKTGLKKLLHISKEESITAEIVTKYANQLRENW